MRLSRSVTVTGLLVLALAAPAMAADDHAGGGTYTSDFTQIRWFVPEGWTPVTHGIPSAGSHSESYPHHAMFSWAAGAAGEMPVTEDQVLVEVGVNPASLLCLPGGEVTPDALIAAVIDYNRRVYPEMAFPTMAPIPAVTLSNGTQAGAVSAQMGETLAGTWSAWMLDDATVGWLFIGGIGDPASRAEVADTIASSLTYVGDAAALEALFDAYRPDDICSPLPA